MNNIIIINLLIQKNEVPDLRESVGWDRRDNDYPTLFERCNFWAGQRDDNGQLIAFGYITGMGLQHGYMEDIIVAPHYQNQGIGTTLVRRLIEEAESRGIEIITVTFAPQRTEFYKRCGFNPSTAGLWQKQLK